MAIVANALAVGLTPLHLHYLNYLNITYYDHLDHPHSYP